MNLEKCLEDAISRHQASRLQEAEQLYRSILKAEPEHPDVNHNLGLLLMQQEQVDNALEFFITALNANPCTMQFWVSYIEALIYKRQFVVAKNILNQGRSNGLDGEVFDQLDSYLADQIEKSKFSPSQAQIDSVIASYSNGQINETLETLKVLIKNYPNEAILHYTFGCCYKDLGQLENAYTSYQRALQLEPNYAEAHHNLASVLRELNRLDIAVIHYKKALSIKQNFTEAYNNLGVTLHELGQFQSAIKNYEKALALNPSNAEILYNLGGSLKSIGQLNLAVDNFEKALKINPGYVEAHNNLGLTLRELCELEASIKCFERAFEINPSFGGAYSNRLLTFNYSLKYNPAFCLREAEKFSRIIHRKVTCHFPYFKCKLTPTRLKIGLVSGDFNAHPVGFFLENVLLELTQYNLELIAYTTQPKFDFLSERIKPLFSEWKAIYGLTNEIAAKVIHDDGIHILFDLSGHTSHNRLPVFAFKPAPVQVSWLGYFATTGLVEMDYVIGDPYVTPVEVENQFSEKIFRLPRTRWCFSPPMVTIKTTALPALKNGYITFGCFNNLAKLNDQVIKLWIKVLHAIPNSRLLLKTKQFNSLSLQGMVTKKFTDLGIDSKRIILEGHSLYGEYLTAYQKVDIALDSFPFTGGTTTIDGLWMGVPVITLQGNTLVSRQGVGILKNVGLTDWIAKNENEYLRKAIDFASNLDELSSLRLGLRKRILGSPLFDAKQFSIDFNNALWVMWQQWLKDNHNST
jgi:protein O-GlcNAc transferase